MVNFLLFFLFFLQEPSNTLFVFDRYAIWLAAMYFFLGSPVYRYVAAAVFVISNTNSIVKALGVNANQILCCNPTVSPF